MKPRYIHDCKACNFLGQHNEYDLYYCARCEGGSVIARRSSEGSDYSSSMLSIVIHRALVELSHGIMMMRGDGTGERIPPRQGDPLYVAAHRVLDRDFAKIKIKNGKG